MKLIIATHNPGKVREFKRILEPLGVMVLSAEDAGFFNEVEETGATFEENARLKAQAVLEFSGLPAIADDSGLCVDALDGAPGVYSARYAGLGAADAQRVKKLLCELEPVPEARRGAHFVSAICCRFPNGEEIMARGECYGYIGREARGENGFGYDPVFYVEEKSFSQLSAQEKDAISHRGRALRAFYEKFRAYRGAASKEGE